MIDRRAFLGAGEWIDFILGQERRQFRRFLLCQKFLASVSRGPYERREGVRRPDTLKIRMAVRRARCRPLAGRRLRRLRTREYRGHHHTDDKEHEFHVLL